MTSTLLQHRDTSIRCENTHDFKRSIYKLVKSTSKIGYKKICRHTAFASTNAIESRDFINGIMSAFNSPLNNISIRSSYPGLLYQNKQQRRTIYFFADVISNAISKKSIAKAMFNNSI